MVYLPHYFYQQPADFHEDLMRDMSDTSIDSLLVMGFRGSAKSTIGSLALILWAALEKPKDYPFILAVADTSLQAGINIANIKNELDNNLLIKQDYGNITGKFVADWDLESEEEWQAKNMLLSNGVRILARSRGQKIRGLRHRQYRPRLVVIDDPEDLEWVRKKENRDKTERWVKNEVIPAMDETFRKLVIIGNQLHTDALIARLKKNPRFKVWEIPLVDKAGRCTWTAKYPDAKALEQLKVDVGPVTYQREYLLKIVPEEGQVVTEEMIHYYDATPAETELGDTATAFDLAISKKSTADFTAGVEGQTAEVDGHLRIFIQPDPINERIDLHELIERAKAILETKAGVHTFLVEDVQYQKAAIGEMEREGLPVEGVKPIGDKMARLKTAVIYIKNGTVLFPRHGCEDLLLQLLGFGIEEHDDLVDALVYLILHMVKNNLRQWQVVGV